MPWADEWAMPLGCDGLGALDGFRPHEITKHKHVKMHRQDVLDGGVGDCARDGELSGTGDCHSNAAKEVKEERDEDVGIDLEVAVANVDNLLEENSHLVSVAANTGSLVGLRRQMVSHFLGEFAEAGRDWFALFWGWFLTRVVLLDDCRHLLSDRSALFFSHGSEYHYGFARRAEK